MGKALRCDELCVSCLEPRKLFIYRTDGALVFIESSSAIEIPI